jgi:hypothetical protein
MERNSTSHGKDYPEVTVSEFVDAVAMRLVQWLIPMMY